MFVNNIVLSLQRIEIYCKFVGTMVIPKEVVKIKQKIMASLNKSLRLRFNALVFWLANLDQCGLLCFCRSNSPAPTTLNKFWTGHGSYKISWTVITQKLSSIHPLVPSYCTTTLFLDHLAYTTLNNVQIKAWRRAENQTKHATTMYNM